MLKKITAGSQRLFHFFLLGICFLLPFQPTFLATVEILTVLFFIVGHSPGRIFKNLVNEKYITLPFFLFFALVAVSYFFSDDKTEAARQVEVKLAFLVIPLLVLGSGMHRRKAIRAITVFIGGCAVACVALLLRAAWIYMATRDTAVFNYSYFSYFMHVTYFAMYLLVCMGWLFMDGLENWVKFPRMYVWLILLFAFCLVLVAAKIMLAAFILSSLLFAGYYAKRRQKIWQALSIVFLVTAMPVVAYLVSPGLKTRVDAVFTDMANFDKQPIDTANIGSTAIRMVIWTDAVPRIKQNLPWGIGAGDVQHMLLQNYEKRHLHKAIDKKLNMHNEYLQQLAGLGIPGLLVFICLMLLPAFVCAPPHRFIGLLFSFTVIVVSLTESIFERQAGTIFFCLLGILLMAAYRKE